MTITTIARSLSTALLALVLAACGGSGGDGSSGSGSGSSGAPADPTTPIAPIAPPVASSNGTIALTTGGFVTSSLSASSVGVEGGALTVASAADPLAGTVLTVPPGAVAETVNVVISSAPVTAATGLPDGAVVRSRAIRVQLTSATSGQAVGALPGVVRLTLPYDGSTTDAVAYYQIESGGVLEAMGHDAIDTTGQTISFSTRSPSLTGTMAVTTPAAGAARVHALDATPAPTSTSLYADYVAVGLSQITLAHLAGATIDTAFRPSRHGFSVPNMGSYYADSRGGNCFGMVGFAKYYWQLNATASLADTYRDALKTSTWVDDATAIELASRVHNQMIAIWSSYIADEVPQQTSASVVERSLVGALYVTRRPTMMYLAQITGGQAISAHAVVAYAATIAGNGAVDFAIYDPNLAKDDTRKVHWDPAQGFSTYQSSTTANAAVMTFNYFRQMGFAVGLTPDQLARDKSDADAGYPSSVFPTITITAITGRTLGDNVLASTGTTPDGAAEYKTSDTAVLIEGTVLGGNAQVAGQLVTSINLITPNGLVQANIDNQAGGGTGKFKAVVPLRKGISTIALLAADPNVVGHWAAFKQIFVESDAAPSYFTATLTWNQGTSDIDLYVKEPDGAPGTANAGKTGDIVYFGHREGRSTTTAYLDFDNTDGYGPENYIIQPGLKTAFTDGTTSLSANGTFTVGVHYFSWNGDDNATERSVGWTVKWRVLKACNNGCANPESDGLWVTGSQTGTLTQDDDQQAGPDGFAAGGSAWSSKFQIPFPAATTSWTVPPSNTVMLP